MINIEKVKSVLPNIVMLSDYDDDNYLALCDEGKMRWGSGFYLLNKSTGKAESFNPNTDLEKFDKAMRNPIWEK